MPGPHCVCGFVGLNERLGGLDGVGDNAACLVHCRLYLFPGALYSLLCFVTEAFGLRFEVVSGIFQIIAGVFNALAKLPASLCPGLGSIEESDSGTG